MPQTSPHPTLTDRAALAAHRARADDSADFLHEEAMDEIQERLIDVNRRFTVPAIVTGHPRIWSDLLPNARVVADDSVLDLQPGAHDLVIHAMSLHWADDPVGQLIQCRRALRPDGLLLVATLGGETLAELRAALAEAEAEVSGGLSPRVAPMGEVRDMGGLLQRAGLALPVADSLPRRVRYRDMFRLMADLRAMGETNALDARHRRTPRRALFARAAQIYGKAFPDADGIRATFEMIFLTGWAPSADQPKPLRPGSATARLADALGVPEQGSER
ncbi:methyltransferase domain-containing protein [Jannaschia sp. M317]|uniref:methyltransferase domain-containing protein n=1 Tax=Jannaschia sp. M317 TaxID=2867011 RepID=UPI0021A74F67|nr:methyltransferase domain-containing protein [Jannaschia sp. M317]UWQ18224.1 methyltransferase domain-containing protein [Jannaschia sp. M317]